MVRKCATIVFVTDFDIDAGASSRLTDVIGLGVLTRLIDRDTVDEVIARADRREVRSRLLPARVVVYLVLAMCLFTSDGYDEVVRKLTNGLRGLRIWRDDWKVPGASAISQARTRLGSGVMAALFDRVAVPAAGRVTVGAWYQQWRVMAIDGTVLDVQDTPVNAQRFGYHNQGGPKQSAFPQVRIVSLVECGTHASVAAEFDGVKTSERVLTDRLASTFTDDMIVLADRGFYSYPLFKTAAENGAQLLWRISNTLDLPVLQYYHDGSFRSELLPSNIKTAIKGGRTPKDADAQRIPVRVIEYMVTGRGETETIRLITTLLEPEQAPADTLAALYQQRWEQELAFDEIKTHQMSPTRLLRSRTPDLVEQEIWALLITHYATQVFITEAADELGADPDRYSFMTTINIIRRQVLNQAAISPLTT
jgi:Insertion element 4 transposase N-terminal/Transposase DDE domain